MPEEPQRNYIKPLVVLGKNWRQSPLCRKKGKEGDINEFHLSVESKIAALAAAMLYIKGEINKIIFTGGKTAGKDWPSEAEAMRNYLLNFYEINLNDILVEDKSMDTAGNAKGVKKILEAMGAKEAIFTTISYHVERARKQFTELGLEGEWLNSDDIVRHRSCVHYQLVKMLHEHPRINIFERTREKIANWLVDSNLSKVNSWFAKVRGKEGNKK